MINIAEEFGASLFVMGILANILGFAFGLTALPAGYLADRVSERHLLILCCLGMAGASIAIGLSTSIFTLGIALLALGLSLGIFHPIGASFITRTVTDRGMGFGYLGVGGNIGVALGPIIAGTISAFLGWRAAYLIIALPILFLAAMFYFSTSTKIPFTQQSTAEASTQKVSLRPVIVPLVLIFAAQVLNGFVYRGIVTFLPLYLSEGIQFSFLNLDSILIAASFTTIALIFGVGGQFLGGYLSGRKRREGLALVIALVTTPLLIGMGTSNGLVLMLTATTFAFFYFMGQPVYNSLVADYSPASWRGRMFGVSFFCTFGFGSFSASMLGYVAGRFGTNWVFLMAAGFEALTMICATVLLLRALRVSGEGLSEPVQNK